MTVHVDRTTGNELATVNQALLLDSLCWERTECAKRWNALRSRRSCCPNNCIEITEQRCSARNSFHASRSFCKMSESIMSLCRKCRRTNRKVGTRGRIAIVSGRLRVSMVAMVKHIVSKDRKSVGRRSDPKYEISSIGSLRGYITLPTAVSS